MEGRPAYICREVRKEAVRERSEAQHRSCCTSKSEYLLERKQGDSTPRGKHDSTIEHQGLGANRVLSLQLKEVCHAVTSRYMQLVK